MHIIYTIIYTPQIQPLAYWSQPTFLTGWPSEVGDADLGKLVKWNRTRSSMGILVTYGNMMFHHEMVTTTMEKIHELGLNRHVHVWTIMEWGDTPLNWIVTSFLTMEKKLSARKQPGVMIPSYGFCTCLVFHLYTLTWMLVVYRSFGPQAKSRVSKNM